jgi:hypothetical protein
MKQNEKNGGGGGNPFGTGSGGGGFSNPQLTCAPNRGVYPNCY